MACIEWTGATQNNGYGQIRRGGKLFLAHRWTFLQTHGYLPTVVRHTCDNRLCVNPKHLIGGTQGQNLRDAVKRGRWKQSKLTEDQVSVIREKFDGGGYTLAALGREYSVSYQQIGNIVKRLQRIDK